MRDVGAQAIGLTVTATRCTAVGACTFKTLGSKWVIGGQVSQGPLHGMPDKDIFRNVFDGGRRVMPIVVVALATLSRYSQFTASYLWRCFTYMLVPTPRISWVHSLALAEQYRSQMRASTARTIGKAIRPGVSNHREESWDRRGSKKSVG